MLSGRRALFRMRVTQPGEVIELDRQQMLASVRNDAVFGEIVMRAFILRRVELVAVGMGDAVLVGSTHSPDTLRIKEFLTRNGHPHSYIDLERDPEVQSLLDAFHIAASEIPVVICRGQLVLRTPTNQQVADGLGFNEAVDQTHLHDFIIVGAGPSGLAAAIYGASEGLTFCYWK
jgi:thioredoxin reductase (NADPH)